MMSVEPDYYFTDDSRIKWHGGNGCVYVECITMHPPSAAGRRVMLHLSPQHVTDLLKVLRDAAREARRVPLT